jgi:hypothetical protein
MTNYTRLEDVGRRAEIREFSINKTTKGQSLKTGMVGSDHFAAARPNSVHRLGARSQPGPGKWRFPVVNASDRRDRQCSSS